MLEVCIKQKLPDFDLEIKKQFSAGVHVIIGPSGAGKTTLLECISGIRTPDAGEVRLNGKLLFSKAGKVNLPAHKRKIGYVFQEYALFPHITVFRNLQYGIQTERLPKQQLRDRIEKMAKQLGITPLLARYPQDLSGGEQQRVALGRALLMEPQVLLLDEPFSALDSETRNKIIPLVKEIIVRQQIPTLLITHHEEVAAEFSSQILRLEHGKFTHCADRNRMI